MGVIGSVNADDVTDWDPSFVDHYMPGEINICPSTSYAIDFHIEYLDITGEEIPELNDEMGWLSCDKHIDIVDKIKHGAREMRVHMDPVGGGKDWDFTKEVQGCWFNYHGSICFANVGYTFDDGDDGNKGL